LDGAGVTELFHEQIPPVPVRTDGTIDPPTIDISPEGTIYLATASEQIILDADGTVVSRTPASAKHPVVAVGPAGTRLWWGGAGEATSIRGALSGGYNEARQAVERRESCSELIRDDALSLRTASDRKTSLPF